MTVQRLRIDTPADLAAAMGAPWQASEQQWAAITAPLAPAVVIAGAGSGKTALMAARVAYLVLTGAVRPDQVLGLTFTTKAASELRGRIRQALTDAGALDDSGSDAEDVLEPTVATYNAYAAGLLTDHGLRIGHEPDTRVITDAARYQLGARVVDRHTGEVAFLSDHPKTVIQNLLDLDGSMSEHLVGPDDVRRVDAEALVGFRAAADEERAGKNRSTYLDKIESAANAIERRGELLGLVDGYRRMKADLGLMDFSDQIELGARLAEDQPEVGVAEREKFRVVLLDEYQDTSVAQATMLARLFGGGHAVTAVGDPNEAIYGWRGASVSNILGFAETFPAKDGACRAIESATVNRRPERRISRRGRLAAPLYDGSDAAPPLEAKPEADEEVVTTRVFETSARSWPGPRRPCRSARRLGDRIVDIGVLTGTRARAEVFDALTRLVSCRDRRAVRAAAAVRGREVVVVLHLLRDVTVILSASSSLDWVRWPIRVRVPEARRRRALGVVPARGRGWFGSAFGSLLSALLLSMGSPARDPRPDDVRRRAGAGYFSPRRWSGSVLLLRSGAVCARTRRSVSTSFGLSSRRPGSTSSSTRRSPRRRPPGATTSDLFVRAVADFQAVDGDVTLLALAGLPDGRGGGEQGARGRRAVRRRLGEAADGAPGQGPRVGCGVPRRGLRRTVPQHPVPDAVDVLARGAAGAAARRRGGPAAARWLRQGGARRTTAPTPRHTRRGEELRLGYVAVTRAAHPLSVTSFCWSPRLTPVRSV